MKIINVNRSDMNYWISWHTEIDKLHNQIQGVYDYIYYNNPPYVVYNNSNRPSDAVISLQAGEPPLINPVQVNNTDYNLFLASALRYHQGFINISNHDNGILSYQDNDGNIRVIGAEKDAGLFKRNYQLTPITLRWNSEQLVGETEECLLDEDDIVADIPLQEVIVMKSLTKNNHVKFTVNNTSAFYDGTVIYPYTNQDNTLIWDKPLGYYTNFPAGYVCISNVQPADEKDDTTSIAKRNFANYLICPLGNGGYYAWNALSNNLTAKYYENEFGHFTNQSIFNLSFFPLRYNNFNYYANNWSGINYSLIAYSNDLSTITIGDLNGNIWNGTKLIQPYTTLKTNNMVHEEIFTDTLFSFDMTIIDQQMVKPVFQAKNETNNSLERIGIKFL